MGTETTSVVVHPEGEQPKVEAWSAVADTYGGRVHGGVGRDGAGDAIRPTAVLHRVPEAGRVVRWLGSGLPIVAEQPECPAQARSAWHRAAVGSGGSPALRPHHGAALRSGEPAAAWHAQS